jgi:hypothetical protein
MGKSQREKGKRGERQWRDKLRAAGFNPATTYRASQYSGKAPDGSSADVVCAELPDIYWEVKNVERLNLWAAYEQAKRDAGDEKIPVVAHTKNQHRWLVTIDGEQFLDILRRSDLVITQTSRGGTGKDGRDENNYAE